jgi:hypothetical protein
LIDRSGSRHVLGIAKAMTAAFRPGGSHRS